MQLSRLPSLARAWLLAASLIFVKFPAFAETACPAHFAGGEEPAVVNAKLAVQTVPLCYQAFAVLHSGLTRTPLWSAEHLTVTGLDGAGYTRRRNSFHAERALPQGQRSELSDYARSGYDRGHMTPSGDMPDAQAQSESFSLANIVPQAPRLNRILWEGVESAVRSLARRDGELFVVTGPIFAGSEVQALQGRVLIPTSIWKAVYDPRTGGAAVYFVANSDDAVAQLISVAQLRNLAGIDPFPSLPEATKQQRMALHLPAPHRGRTHY